MKRVVFAILLSLFTLLTAVAQGSQGLAANQRLLGYSVTDSITMKGVCFGEAGTYSVGALLESDVLSSYKGCRVVGLRVAAAMNLGRLRTFIYNFTGTAFDEVVAQNQRIYEGWNNIFLNGDGYEIKGDENLFFGFDYVETEEMVAAEEGGMCTVGSDTEGGFYVYGDYGQGQGLYSISKAGCLCVQLIVDVSNLPRHDMKMTYLDTGFKHKVPGENIDVMTAFINVGRDTIFHYQMGWQLDEQAPVYTNISDTLLSGQKDYWTFTVPLPDDIATGQHTLNVFISEVEGQPSAHAPLIPELRSPTRSLSSLLSPLSSLLSKFYVYRASVGRSQVYVEVYTDQTSPYVPYLNNAMVDVKKECQEMCLVNVHRPGTPLSVVEAEYLHDLYAYTWPTFTINRSYFPGEAYISYDMNDYLPAVPKEFIAGILSSMVFQDLLSPAFATLDLQGQYDSETRQLTVTASGKALEEARLFYGPLALTLMLTEDGVKGRQAVYNEMLGRTTTNQNYVHNQVLRTYMTAPTGDPVDVAEDDNYTATFTTKLNEAWNADKLTVVALLTKAADTVTDDNVLDMDILNCNSLALSDIAKAGIDSPQLSTLNSQLSTFYTLDGKRVNDSLLRPGLYIEHRVDGTSRKVLVR